jgi:redox-sensitive bicupin YhaK (pirin superfamily)
MNQRPVIRQVAARSLQEGAGVRVHRTLGTPECRNLDPFLMLDRFESDDPEDYGAGFPDHPHRGFVTFTYMLDGHMAHGDSMGNQGRLDPGGAQWMKAASGVIHSEMPRQEAGLMRGFQLWINLPVAEKMSAPDYQEIRPDSVPVLEADGTRVRVLIGPARLGDQATTGPVIDPHTDVRYLDITLQPGAGFEQALPAGHHAFAFVFEGSATVAGEAVATDHLAVLGDGEGVAVTAGDNGARMILVAGAPLGEPVVQHGPFVMDSREGIQQAFDDFRAGRLVRERAGFHET